MKMATQVFPQPQALRTPHRAAAVASPRRSAMNARIVAAADRPSDRELRLARPVGDQLIKEAERDGR